MEKERKTERAKLIRSTIILPLVSISVVEQTPCDHYSIWVVE